MHVDVRGLQPGRHYWYRFRVDGHVSQTGRTRTAPAPGQHGGQLTLGVSSCQAWTDGYYTAQGHLATEDVDAVVFLGDYIYEFGISAAGGLRNLTDPVPDQFRTEADTLDRYRLQYALYKADPNLQAAHQNAPWITTWDDHEVQDNYAGLIVQEQRSGRRLPGTPGQRLPRVLGTPAAAWTCSARTGLPALPPVHLRAGWRS